MLKILKFIMYVVAGFGAVILFLSAIALWIFVCWQFVAFVGGTFGDFFGVAAFMLCGVSPWVIALAWHTAFAKPEANPDMLREEPKYVNVRWPK